MNVREKHIIAVIKLNVSILMVVLRVIVNLVLLAMELIV